MSQTENCYWFTGTDYVAWIFNYSIKATGIPCLRHVRHMASPGCLLHLFQILCWFWQVLCIKSTLYIYTHTSFLKEHDVDQSTILSFYLSIWSAFFPVWRTKKSKKMYERITVQLRWEDTFGECLIQLSWLYGVTYSRLFRTLIRWGLSISKVGEQTSLGNLLQYLITFTLQKFSSDVQMPFPVFQNVPIDPCPLAWHPWEKPGSTHLAASLQAFMYIHKISPEPFFSKLNSPSCLNFCS